MALHAAVQSLTFEDVLDAAENRESLVDALTREGTHEAVRNAVASVRNAPRPASEQGVGARVKGAKAKEQTILAGNHVLSVTHTTVGVEQSNWRAFAYDAVEKTGEEQPPNDWRRDDVGRVQQNITGFVEGYVRAGHVSAGHAWDVERKTRDLLQAYHHHLHPRSDYLHECRIGQAGVARCLLGRHDLDWSATWKRDTRYHAISTARLIELCCFMWHEIPRSAEEETGSETGLAELSTAIVVPVPQSDESGFPYREQAPEHQPVILALRSLSACSPSGASETGGSAVDSGTSCHSASPSGCTASSKRCSPRSQQRSRTRSSSTMSSTSSIATRHCRFTSATTCRT